MRLIIIAKLVLLTAIIAPPVSGHVLMPLSYKQRQAAAQLIVIAETKKPSSGQAKTDSAIEFRVLATLKGRRLPSLGVLKSTRIQEEELNCCIEGRYILFLVQGRNGLYESVNGNYGAVRLVE